MAHVISIDKQRLSDPRVSGCIYVSKMAFITGLWRRANEVVLLCHPRRSGRTLDLDAVRRVAPERIRVYGTRL